MSRYGKTIGIIAGLGPLAGANFYRRLVEATAAEQDQDHPSVLLISDSQIPSRLDHLSGRGPSPLPALQEVARRLWDNGAEVIALTSITTHAYYAELAATVPIPIVNALTATATALGATSIHAPALVVTKPVRSSGLLQSALIAEGIEPRLPDDMTQDEIQSVVVQMKAGADPVKLGARLQTLLGRDWVADADGVLIGCTDISPLVDLVDQRMQDVAIILARAVLSFVEAP